MSDLRARAIRGVAWTAAQRWTVRATGFVTFVVLSRFLGPAEIGVVALALAVVGTLAALADLGMGDFIVRSEDMDGRTASTIFWLELAIAGATTVVLYAAARPLGAALGMSSLASVLQVSALLLPVSACAVVPTALLHRELAFRELALRDAAATLLGAATGVTAAVLGAGVWALVLQAGVQSCVGLVCVLALARWRPIPAFSPKTLRQAFRFIGPLAGVQLIQAVRDRADQFIIAPMLGTQALGLWLVAARLVGIVTEMSASTLETVAMPVFSRVRRDADQFRRVHAFAASYAVLLLVPSLLFLAFASPVLVRLFFGAQWQPAVIPTQVLCVSYAIFGLTFLNRPTLVVHGRTGVEFALSATALSLHVILVLVASLGGLVDVAWAMVAEAVVLVGLGSVTVRRSVGLRPPVPRRSLRILAVGVVAAAAGVLFERVDRLIGVAAASLATLTTLVVFGVLMCLVDAALVRDAGRDARRLLSARAKTEDRARPVEPSSERLSDERNGR